MKKKRTVIINIKKYLNLNAFLSNLFDKTNNKKIKINVAVPLLPPKYLKDKNITVIIENNIGIKTIFLLL